MESVITCRFRILIFLMLMMQISPASAQHPKKSISPEEKTVLQTEKSRFKAMVERDLETLNLIISDDLIYIHSNGSVDTKASFIEAISSGKRSYDEITMEDSQIRVYGSVGIINSKCTYHRRNAENRSNNLKLLYTSVYARVDDAWKHVSWQSFKLSD